MYEELKKYAEIALKSHGTSSLSKSLQITDFYSRANPSAVLALIAEVERLTSENKEIEAAAITYIEDMQEAQNENEKLNELFAVGMTLDGNLRVYGDWQSVRAAQELFCERDNLKAENARSTEREILQLAEIEMLRKDAERYRWIRKESNLSDYEDCYSLPMVNAWDYKPGAQLNEQFESLDAAIDAAMAEAVGK